MAPRQAATARLMRIYVYFRGVAESSDVDSSLGQNFSRQAFLPEARYCNYDHLRVRKRGQITGDWKRYKERSRRKMTSYSQRFNPRTSLLHEIF